jgi:hypothetical protein
MTFSERMKGLASKAGDAAQDLASKAGDTAQDLGNKGIAASKDFIDKAGDKFQEISEKSKLLVEIKQLESKAQKLLTQLGSEVYKAFAEQKLTSVGPTTSGIKEIFEELDALEKEIEQKEAEAKKK